MDLIESLYQLYRRHPRVYTDSRQTQPEGLFFALKGERFDGNRFARQALDQGAAAVVVDDPAVATDPRSMLVPDVLQALQDLAAHHRRQFDFPVVAIGGSNGKTTTKELVSAVLSSHYQCHSTRGNLNNHIGVPLTLLAMPEQTEIAVIEMGANQPGDIDQLCRIAEPTHGLITNIGKEHLEGFGSLAGVKKAEGELYRYLARHNGCAFVNAAEKYLPAMARANHCKVVYTPTPTLHATSPVIEAQLLEENPFVRAGFLDEEDRLMEVQTRLVGRHNFQNILTAIALGIYFKVPASLIRSALETFVPSNNRSQIIRRDTNTYFLDAYNANPSSMEAALQSVKALPAPRKVAILGDMLELGAESHKEHEALLRRAVRSRFNALVLVGPEFGRCNPGQYNALHFTDAAGAGAWLREQNFTDTLVLIKGSRGLRLEQVIDGTR
jgi:UDP-N-acetylmuramoyl-tripeptide--D-alanyl-D-alanine ligase